MALLGCPRCEQALNKQADGRFACGACKVQFPNLTLAEAEVPFLWPEPGAALLDWRNRFNAALADIEQQQFLSETAEGDGALADRLARLTAGFETYKQELQALLAPLAVGEAIAKETHLALRTRLPTHHGVLSYAQNIHRDWAWGDDENNAVAAHLAEVLRDAPLPETPRILVLGCGAGRLAYDLRRQTGGEVWALDSNPLLCLIGAAVSRGATLALTEFPLAPIDAELCAVPRTLEAEPVDNLHFVCGDALRPPFAPGSFDLVVTPWLIDVVDASVADLVNVIARLLAPGGQWLNHGSIAFTGADPVNRMSEAELAEETARLGMQVIHTSNVRLPYLQSPASRQHRTELTYTQLALKTDAVSAHAPEKNARHQHLPDWIVVGKQPIPLSREFQTQIHTTRIHAFIMSLIDGKRSLSDMAQVMEDQRLMPKAEAQQAIRQFLLTMYEEAQALKGRARR